MPNNIEHCGYISYTILARYHLYYNINYSYKV